MDLRLDISQFILKGKNSCSSSCSRRLATARIRDLRIFIFYSFSIITLNIKLGRGDLTLILVLHRTISLQ